MAKVSSIERNRLNRIVQKGLGLLEKEYQAIHERAYNHKDETIDCFRFKFGIPHRIAKRIKAQ